MDASPYDYCYVWTTSGLPAVYVCGTRVMGPTRIQTQFLCIQSPDQHAKGAHLEHSTTALYISVMLATVPLVLLPLQRSQP